MLKYVILAACAAASYVMVLDTISRRWPPADPPAASSMAGSAATFKQRSAVIRFENYLRG